MNQKNNQKHGFHLVDPSPWHLISAFSALMLTFGAVLFMHGYSNGNFLVKFGFIMIIFSMFCWWRDVIREATFEGQHTTQVQAGLKKRSCHSRTNNKTAGAERNWFFFLGNVS